MINSDERSKFFIDAKPQWGYIAPVAWPSLDTPRLLD